MAVIEPFGNALIPALPELPQGKPIRPRHLALGAMSGAIAAAGSIQLIAGYAPRETDHIESIMKRIVPFPIAGPRAPLLAATGSASPQFAATSAGTGGKAA